MYLGQNDMRSLAALMELAEMLMPRVTIIKPMAPKAAAARPPLDPDAIQRLMISMGFHMTSPYADCAAAAVKMPSRPTIAVDPDDEQRRKGHEMRGGRLLTEDDRDDDGLDVLRAGFVGIPRKIGDVQAQSGVVAEDPVEICSRRTRIRANHRVTQA